MCGPADLCAGRFLKSAGSVCALGMLLIAAASAARGDIIITEIHYAPVDLDDPSLPRDDLEFVELFNDGPEVYDLSGFQFTRGIDLVFPEGTFIEGRGYLVIAKSPEAVRSAYGITGVVSAGFAGMLDNSGETIELANPQGVPVCSVSYNDRGQWPSAAKGTGHSLSIRYEYLDPSDADSWTISAQRGGTPGVTNFQSGGYYQDRTIIADGEIWKYFKGTAAPPASWKDLAFNDNTWLSGPAGIGYGDGDDRTELTDMQNSYLSVFCRKRFTVTSPGEIDRLVLRVVVDDGFAAYLNSTEVASYNLTGRDYNDTADDPVDNGDLVETDISEFKHLLVAGENILAVQVHNVSLGSSDLSFIPELFDRRITEPESLATVPVWVNEGHFRTAGERFVELYNESTTAVDLSGFHLTDLFSDLTRYRIAGGTSIGPRGFLVFTEEDLGFDLSIVEGVKERVAIALVNAAGTRVIDARIFEPKVDGKSEARFPDGGRRFSPAAEPTPGAANQVDVVRDVIFNELMYHPISDLDRDEYIELHNRGSAVRDIGGWRVEGVNHVFPPDTVIGPGEYIVIAKDPERIRSIYGLDETVVPSPGYEGRLANGGERLRLLDASENIADQVRYRDGGEWPRWADGLGSSLERIDPFGEASVATTWDASDDAHKASTRIFSYVATQGSYEPDLGMMLMDEGIAIVDDIALEPAGGGSSLISNGTFNTSTSGWVIEGTHILSGRTTQPGEVIAGGGSLKLIAYNGTGDYKVNRIETQASALTFGASYRITFKARWVVGGRTILTIGDYNVGYPHHPSLAGSSQLDVPLDLGTPGAVNSATLRQIDSFGTSNQGPAIDEVSHSPGVPESGEAVTVSARVRDPDGISLVRLYYRLENPSGTFSQTAMSDADGDGIYEGTIPGQAIGTRVLFYVAAVDGEGLIERFPVDIFSRTHPPVVNTSSPPSIAARYAMYRHDQRIVSTSYHSYRFVLDADRENELRYRRVLSNQMLDGTFIFGSEDVYYNAQIRFAGSPWLRGGNNDFNKSYALKMPKDNWLHGRKSAFNLDEHSTDGRERMAHFLLRRNAGHTRLPYFDGHALVRFQLSGVHTSTREALDKPNRQYMDFWFPEDPVSGAHYEMDDRFSFNDNGDKTGNAEGKVLYPPYGGTTGGTNKENYRWYFALRNRKGDDDFAPMLSMCNLMDSRTTADSTFDGRVFDSLDVEEFLRVWAIELNIGDWDTWGGERGKNCYFYQSTADGLWRLVPWDLELTFESGRINFCSMPSSPTNTYSNHFTEITRMINRPKIKRLYYGILKEQVDGFFFTGAGSPLSEYASQLSGSGVSLGNVLGFVTTRSSMIRSWIQPAVYPQVRLRITTNGGSDITTDETAVVLDGEAPAEIRDFIVSRNGRLLDDPAPAFSLSSSNIRGWRTQIPLEAGDNEVEILGFDTGGSLVDSDSIRISSTPAWGRPAIRDVTPNPALRGEEITIEGDEFHDGLVVVFGGLVLVSDVEFDEAVDPTRIRLVVPFDVLGTSVAVDVRNTDGQTSDAFLLELLSEPRVLFVRGDSNLDGQVDISDAVATLGYLFLGGTVGCEDACDTDDNGWVELTDAVVGLSHLFQGGSPPAPPFPDPGTDSTSDSLGCERGL